MLTMEVGLLFSELKALSIDILGLLLILVSY